MLFAATRKQELAGAILLLIALLLSACMTASGRQKNAGSGGADVTVSAESATVDEEPASASATSQGAQTVSIDDEQSADDVHVDDQIDAGQEVTAVPPIVEPTIASTPTASPQSLTATPELVSEDGVFLQDDRPEYLRLATSDWNTDWAKHTVDYDEFLSGGPPRDGIRSLDEPQFVSIEDANAWLAGNEPVIALEFNDEARAYPLQILTWHEIVNDTINDLPVIVTFCPLCNSAVVFNRQLAGEAYEFGTSGLLRNSDLVMYDRTTESLWQQFTGEAIVGDLIGETLEFLPSSMVSYAEFREAFPEGTVLSQTTGFDRPYGVNPYVGYDTYESSLSQGGNIVLLKQEQDRRLPAADRVVTVSVADSEVDIAYPLSILSERSVINDHQGEQDLVLFHSPGTSTALGAQLIAIAEDVGATGVFDPNLNGQVLSFSKIGEQIVDDQTSSVWNIFGQAVAGELEGNQLSPIIHGDHFWFSWAAFKPNTIIYQE